MEPRNAYEVPMKVELPPSAPPPSLPAHQQAPPLPPPTPPPSLPAHQQAPPLPPPIPPPSLPAQQQAPPLPPPAQQSQAYVVGPSGTTAPPVVAYSEQHQTVQFQTIPASGYTVGYSVGQTSNVEARIVDSMEELPEAVVSKPLSIISLFFFLQLWFSIPAIVFAYNRKSTRYQHQVSIALSVTAIVLGICGAITMMSLGLVYPWVYCYSYSSNPYWYCDYY